MENNIISQGAKNLDLGYIFLADGRFDEAKKQFLLALENDPECSRAYSGLFLVSVKAVSFEALTANFLIPKDSELSGYAQKPDPVILYDDPDALYAKYGVEYFNTKEDIIKAASVGGSGSKESTLIYWIEKEKNRFIQIWDNDANIKRAMEFGTLEEQFKLGTYRDNYVALFDRVISGYDSERSKRYSNKKKEAQNRIKNNYDYAKNLESGLADSIKYAENSYNRGDYTKAYNQIRAFEKHPKASELMRKASAAEHKRIDIIHLGIAAVLALIYVVVALVVTFSENDHWTVYPLVLESMFFVSYALLRGFEHTVIQKSCSGLSESGRAKASSLPLKAFCVVATILAVAFNYTSAEVYDGFVDNSVALAMSICLMPMIVATVALLLNATREMKLVSVITIAVCTAMISGIPSSTFGYGTDIVYCEGIDDPYTHIILPILCTIIFAILIPYVGVKYRRRDLALVTVAALVIEIVSAVICDALECYGGLFTLGAIFLLVSLVISYIAFNKFEKIERYVPTYQPRSIDSYRVLQAFDYKTPKRAGKSGGSNSYDYDDDSNNSSGGNYYNDSDDDDSGSSSSDSAWNFDYLSGGSNDSNSYDSADYNARSMGYSDANDASSSTGMSGKDLYY